MDHGASVNFTLGPNATTMSVNHPLNECQTNASAFKLLGTVKTLKYSKQFVLVLHIESSTVIRHGIYDASFRTLSIHLNDGPFSLRREFDGIRK
jgi:hypothetical protein